MIEACSGNVYGVKSREQMSVVPVSVNLTICRDAVWVGLLVSERKLDGCIGLYNPATIY